MKRLLILCVVACLAIPALADDADKDTDKDKDQTKAEDRIKAAGTVLEEIESAPDQGIPEEVLGSANAWLSFPPCLKADSLWAPAMDAASPVAAHQRAGAHLRSLSSRAAALVCR